MRHELLTIDDLAALEMDRALGTRPVRVGRPPCRPWRPQQLRKGATDPDAQRHLSVILLPQPHDPHTAPCMQQHRRERPTQKAPLLMLAHVAPHFSSASANSSELRPWLESESCAWNMACVCSALWSPKRCISATASPCWTSPSPS